MARKNTIKRYVENGYYHIYNRGVDRRDIFLEPDDFVMFLTHLERYLAPVEVERREGFKSERPYLLSHKQQMNLHGKVQLVSYCLMPNHFHLLVSQTIERGITHLMRRVCTNYNMYFNKKYDRRGSLFESVYKAALVDNDQQLIHLSRYIHLNPVNIKISRFGPVATVATAKPDEYEYSSYHKYLERQILPWFDPTPILNLFGENNKYGSYQSFVEDYRVDSLSLLGSLTLEEKEEKR